MDQVPGHSLATRAPEPSDKPSALAPPRKRPRAADARDAEPSKRRNKRKSLSLLTDMPLDIIFEIFSKLQPGDLTALSRSNKAFRKMLLHRSSITIWQAARNNVPGLPDCPPELSEPAYANLVFTSNCHYCGKQGIQVIEWLLLVRCCKSCRENSSIFFDATNHPNDRKRDWLRLYFPSIIRGRSVYVRMTDLIPFLADWERRGDKDEQLDVLLKETMENTTRLKQRIVQYQVWDEGRNRSREQELDSIRAQRRRAVWAKLAILGLGGEEALLSGSQKDRLENMEGMKEPTPLTERNWLKIKNPIISFIRNARKERVRKERSAPYCNVLNAMIPHLDAYGRTQPLTECFPTTMEFCSIPSVREYIDELITPGTTIDPVRFNMLIPSAIEEWSDNISRHLTQLLPPWLAGPSNAAGLRSALVWFRCANSSKYSVSCEDTTLGFPRILVHQHVRRERRAADDPQGADDDLANAVRENCLRSPYVFDADELRANVAFDVHASFAAAELVQACGLDPARATAQEMDACDARVACVPCRQVMSWRKAVAHVYKPCHKGRREWVVLDGEDTNALLRLEAKDRPRTTTGAFWCMRCRRFDRAMYNFFSHKGLKALKSHMEQIHGIVQFRPKYNVDYYVHDGEPMNDGERPLPVAYKDLDFKISTPELAALGW
ncbi:F-box protein [Phanerochaete sordida]|uniref:F-box protein n=1 Tax=Phanerochaete sordida TaxID=48140 RepID=A0A9P3G9G3_9APHY|nr:F-box protein [Phanerochaete sordida]